MDKERISLLMRSINRSKIYEDCKNQENNPSNYPRKNY